MSASLVGSEMCIRDRTSSDTEHKCSKTAAGNQNLASAPTRCRALPVPPVSYTHLTLPTICSV
eukprot:9668267-Alexandrium_andersonii.AAC.1